MTAFSPVADSVTRAGGPWLHTASHATRGFLIYHDIVLSQNLESKLASCREYVQEQTANCKGHAGREGATSSHNNPSAANGIYSKGCVEARKQYSVPLYLEKYFTLWKPSWKLRQHLSLRYFFKLFYKITYFMNRFLDGNCMEKYCRTH